MGLLSLVGLVVDVELAGLDGAGACRGRQADAASAHAGPLPQAVRPHDRAPGGCVPPVTSLAVTLAVTLVGYRAPARATPSPPCPVSLALSTPSPSPRGNLLADVSYDGTVTMLSLANPPRPDRAATMQTVTARR